MRVSGRWLVLGSSLVAAGFSGLTAQIPGDEMERGNRNFRNEYLSQTYQDLKPLFEDWRELHSKHDLKSLLKIITEDAVYSPVEGVILQHRSEIGDSLARRLPKVQGYWSSVIDFTASGGLAYFLGRFSYHLSEADGKGRDMTGTFTMVWFLDGRNWRVRSYVERRDDSGG